VKWPFNVNYGHSRVSESPTTCELIGLDQHYAVTEDSSASKNRFIAETAMLVGTQPPVRFIGLTGVFRLGKSSVGRFWSAGVIYKLFTESLTLRTLRPRFSNYSVRSAAPCSAARPRFTATRLHRRKRISALTLERKFDEKNKCQ
jgi:hypothetical protein